MNHLLSPLARVLAAAAVLSVSSPVLRAQGDPPLLAEGSAAPDFTSHRADGTAVHLADLAGKVVVVDFWATWCQPCLQSFPRLQKAAAAHRAAGVVALAVCTTDSRDKFAAWVEANAAKYPDVVFTCDPNDRASKTYDQRASSALYHVSGLPTKFVVGADGKVAMAIVGDQEDDVRLDAGLARAGLTIDPAVRERGEKQQSEFLAAQAELARKRAANPPPPFAPVFGSIAHGQPMPDFTLIGGDGAEFALSSLRGKLVVIGFGWGDVLPRDLLDDMQKAYGRHGVQCVGAMVMTTREDFDAWCKNNAAVGFRVGWDPAGKPKNLTADDDERRAWDKAAVLRRFFTGNMLPAMPAFVACDAQGNLLGSFSARTWREALGNFLLKTGVELDAADRPQVVVGPEAWAPPKPRAPEAPVQLIATGQPAPDFDMVTANGAAVHLRDFAGKVVVLDFWATWCGPCLLALPHVQELAHRHAADGVVVVASCTGDDRGKFDAWVAEHAHEYPDVLFAFDPLERSPERASRKLYGVGGIPQQFVVGRDGRIAAAVTGYLQGEVLLDAALAAAGIAVPAAVLEQAVKDQAARDAKQKGAKPAAPMVPLRPAGGGR